MMRQILAVIVAGALALVVVPVQAEKDAWEESKSYIGGFGLGLCGLWFGEQYGFSFEEHTGHCISSANFTIPVDGDYQIIMSDQVAQNVGGYWKFCTAEGDCPDIWFSFCNSTSTYLGADWTIQIVVDDPIFGLGKCKESAFGTKGEITMTLLG